LWLLWNNCKACGQYYCELSTSVVSLKALTFILRRYTVLITRDFCEINGVSSCRNGTHQENYNYLVYVAEVYQVVGR
jgi:hypothetical protein